MRGFATLCALSSLGILAVGLAVASREDVVYGPAADYSVVRLDPDADGHERVRLSFEIRKVAECDLERGDGPVWIDFYDGEDGAPPPSSLYRPDGSIAGTTMIKAGQSLTIEGYTAVVPHRLRGLDGTMIVRVPCQLWTHGKDGQPVWGRKIVASYGPLAIPPPGATALSIGGVVAISWKSKS